MPSEKPPCPECGGRKFGRGYSHKAGCSKAFNAGAKTGKRGRRGRPRGSRNVVRTAGSVSIDAIHRMPIDQLIELRRAADEALKARHGEVKKLIGGLRELLRS